MSKEISTEHPDLKKSSYFFDLPDNFIAKRPVANRSMAKLMISTDDQTNLSHTYFKNIGDYLPKNSVLVFNSSKVFKARVFAHKKSGGKAEIFFLKAELLAGEVEVLIRSRGKKLLGDEYILPLGKKIIITKILHTGSFVVRFIDCDNDSFSLAEYIEKSGKLPIPPYIRDGMSDQRDEEDYQTVFADELGSVASPTAGLHFDQKLIESLKNSGHEILTIRLDVGLGTFRPVKAEEIKDHQMHSEEFFIDQATASKLNHYKKINRPIIAVGTTSLRALESAYCPKQKKFISESGSTDIFIYPGVEVHSISGLITNFHLPESTLLMLVSALIGREKLLELYELAKKNDYRFFSYGDGMMVFNQSQNIVKRVLQ